MATFDEEFSALETAGIAPSLIAEISKFAREAPEEELARINPLTFSRVRGLDEDAVIDAFLHASRMGLFDLQWNLLCPGCGAILGANASLKSITKTHYSCSLCVVRYEVTLDHLVEVNFSVSPRVRRIAYHEPDTLPLRQYVRQMFFSPSLVMPTGTEWDALWEQIVLEAVEVPAGTEATLSLTLAEKFLIVFEPTTHAAIFMDVKGEPVTEVQEATVRFTDAGTAPAVLSGFRPGPMRLRLQNQKGHRVLPSVFIADEQFHNLTVKHPYLTAKRLITLQSFRDLYRTDTLSLDQSLKISNLTMLFTDLKGSTELYERVGDLTAYELVQSHFRVLGQAVRQHGGSVVKTIGDAVMATFSSPRGAMEAAFEMRDGIDRLNAATSHEDLLVKIGLHTGPCLAVMSNERLDYFGQTVNIAARVQGLADSRAIFATEAIVRDADVDRMLSKRNSPLTSRRAALKGIRDEVLVYEIV